MNTNINDLNTQFATLSLEQTIIEQLIEHKKFSISSKNITLNYEHDIYGNLITDVAGELQITDLAKSVNYMRLLTRDKCTEISVINNNSAVINQYLKVIDFGMWDVNISLLYRFNHLTVDDLNCLIRGNSIAIKLFSGINCFIYTFSADHNNTFKWNIRGHYEHDNNDKLKNIRHVLDDISELNYWEELIGNTNGTLAFKHSD